MPPACRPKRRSAGPAAAASAATACAGTERGGASLTEPLIDGRYRLLRRLGEGGHGIVWEALHEEMQRAVALKVLVPALGGDEAALQRFRREARAAARLKHPHVVVAYDFGRTETGQAGGPPAGSQYGVQRPIVQPLPGAQRESVPQGVP